MIKIIKNIKNKKNGDSRMIPEVQGLRCIAILMIIYFHLPLILTSKYLEFHQKISRNFILSTGVGLLFVLAGFFLMKSLSKMEKYNIPKIVDNSIPQNSNNLKIKIEILFEFILKKFKRLAPASYFWVIVSLLLCLITKNEEFWLSRELMLKKFFATIIWLRNFEVAFVPTHLGYHWAVSLEFQVFIVFSIFYFIIGKNKTIFLSIFICIIMMFFRPAINSQYWLFRFDPILWGTIVYYLFEKIDKNFLNTKFKSKKYGFL